MGLERLVEFEAIYLDIQHEVFLRPMAWLHFEFDTEGLTGRCKCEYAVIWMMICTGGS